MIVTGIVVLVSLLLAPWIRFSISDILIILKAGILYLPPPRDRGVASVADNKWEELNYSRFSSQTNGLLRLKSNMVTELIRPVHFNPGICQRLIKLKTSCCRSSQLECRGESVKAEAYSAIYTPLLPLTLT